MEAFLFVCLLLVLVVRWFQLRERLAVIEARLDALTDVVMAPPPVMVQPAVVPVRAPEPEHAPEPPPAPAPPEPPPAMRPSAPIPWTDREPLPQAAEPVETVEEPAPRPRSRTSEEWEALLGGSWMNKAGVFVVVIGLALLLNYAYTHIGPAGRVALSYTGALAMLIAGMVVERRERYRNFAYGLIGGGWAALYLTTYAMHAIEAARVLESPLIAGILLLAVAVGMIVHSLRYQSRTVTGLAYFIAFATLAIGEVTAFSVAALIPLAASLLYVARSNEWGRFALFGLIATYATVAMHKDTGSPLWQAQMLFLVYWLLFEAFDLIHPDPWLLPLNGLGFLVLSSAKWAHSAPSDIWQLAAGSAALYLGSTIVRAHSGRWRAAVTFNAALAAAAILLKLEHQWVAVALLILGELYYLAGVRFRSTYLRVLAAAMFALELGDLAVVLLPNELARTWEPVAVATAVAFYVNRALRSADQPYGYLAAGLAALVGGYEASPFWRGRVWSLMAVAPFAFGWWRRQMDFRLQAYGLGAIGAIATAAFFPLPAASLALSAVLTYALVQCTLRSGEDRFHELEREAVRIAACVLTLSALAALVWRLVPGDWLGLAWLVLAWATLEAGLLDQPRDFRRLSYLLLLLGATRALVFDWDSRFALAGSVVVYGYSWRARREENGRVMDVATFPATLLLLTGLHAVLPWQVLPAAWAVIAVGLGEFDRRSLLAQSVLVAAAAFARAADAPLVQSVPVIVCFGVAMLRRPLGTWLRLYFSVLASALLAVLIYHEVSGSLLTIAWGFEGIALLAAGFPLRDRVLRLSGLAAMAVCTGKLFFWDLRNLETLPRIVSFIVLGLLLVAVSWVYTRFRDQVRRML